MKSSVALHASWPHSLWESHECSLESLKWQETETFCQQPSEGAAEVAKPSNDSTITGL